MPESSINSLFPTAILTADLSEVATHNETFLDRIKTYPHNPEHKMWHTPDTLHTDEVFSPLKEAIEECAKEYLQAMGYQAGPLEYTGMWANIQTASGFHPPHVHPNNLLSGAYYVKSNANDSSHSIVFTDPRPQSCMIQPPMAEVNRYNQKRVTLPGVPGRLYLFPSWLQHYVKANEGSERVSISFNIVQRGDMGSHQNFTHAKW